MKLKQQMMMSIVLIAVFIASPLASSSIATTNNTTQQSTASITQTAPASAISLKNPLISTSPEGLPGSPLTQASTSSSYLITTGTSQNAQASSSQASVPTKPFPTSADYPKYWYAETPVQITGYAYTHNHNYLMGNGATNDWGGFGIGVEVTSSTAEGLDTNNYAATTFRIAIHAGVLNSLRGGNNLTAGLYYLKYIRLDFIRLNDGPDYQEVHVGSAYGRNVKLSMPQAQGLGYLQAAVTVAEFIIAYYNPYVAIAALAFDVAQNFGLGVPQMASESQLDSHQHITGDAVAIWVNPGGPQPNSDRDLVSDYTVKEGSASATVQWNTYEGTTPWMLMVTATVGLGRVFLPTGNTDLNTETKESSASVLLRLTPDQTAPSISHVIYGGISYPANSPLKHYITWDVSDASPEGYKIDQQIGTGAPATINSGHWDDLVRSISQDVSGLPVGTYTYTLTVWDRHQPLGSWSSSDSETVTVTNDDPNTPAADITATPVLQSQPNDWGTPSVLFTLRNNLLPNPDRYDKERVWNIYASANVFVLSGEMDQSTAAGASIGVWYHTETNNEFQPSTGYFAEAHVQIYESGQIGYNTKFLYDNLPVGQTYNIHFVIETGYLDVGANIIHDQYYQTYDVYAQFTTYDATPPNFTSTPSNIIWPAGQQFSLTWTASDTGSGPYRYEIKVGSDPIPIKSGDWTTNDEPLTYTTSQNTLGPYTYTCTVWDAAGNYNTASVTVTITAGITITSPADQAWYTVPTGSVAVTFSLDVTAYPYDHTSTSNIVQVSSDQSTTWHDATWQSQSQDGQHNYYNWVTSLASGVGAVYLVTARVSLDGGATYTNSAAIWIWVWASWESTTIPSGHHYHFSAVQTPYGLGLHLDTQGFTGDNSFNFLARTTSVSWTDAYGSIRIQGYFRQSDTFDPDLQPGRRVTKLYIVYQDTPGTIAQTVDILTSADGTDWKYRDVTIFGLRPNYMVFIGVGRFDAWDYDWALAAEWANVQTAPVEYASVNSVSITSPPNQATYTTSSSSMSISFTVDVNALLYNPSFTSINQVQFTRDGGSNWYGASYSYSSGSNYYYTWSSSFARGYPATYTIQARVSVNGGSTWTYSQTITIYVQPPPPTVTSNPSSVTYYYGIAHYYVTFTVTGAGPGPYTISGPRSTSGTWSSGQQISFDVGGLGYISEGQRGTVTRIFIFVFTATDSLGQRTSYTLYVYVICPPYQ